MFITYSCEKQFQDLNNIKTNISIKQKKKYLFGIITIDKHICKQYVKIHSNI